mmetsp:Transcript_2681/g.5966  ORF Transcript_2681/g.5966 Transcript_2681/m.5966 type:complete len:229 (+) Transcript_2681:338-1024(+)
MMMMMSHHHHHHHQVTSTTQIIRWKKKCGCLHTCRSTACIYGAAIKCKNARSWLWTQRRARACAHRRSTWSYGASANLLAIDPSLLFQTICTLRHASPQAWTPHTPSESVRSTTMAMTTTRGRAVEDALSSPSPRDYYALTQPVSLVTPTQLSHRALSCGALPEMHRLTSGQSFNQKVSNIVTGLSSSNLSWYYISSPASAIQYFAFVAFIALSPNHGASTHAGLLDM